MFDTLSTILIKSSKLYQGRFYVTLIMRDYRITAQDFFFV